MSMPTWPVPDKSTERIHAIADRLVSTPEWLETWRNLARMWLGDDMRKKRQQINYVLWTIAHEAGLSDDEACAWQRGFTAGLNAALDVYSPRRDA